MPSPKRRSPRIQVTLSEQAMSSLEAIAQMTGQGKATLVSELVEHALPAMAAATEALRHVKESPREAQRILSRYANEATAMLAQEQLEFDDLLSATPAPKRKKRKRGTDGPA